MASNIVVPEVGESIVDARIAKWLRHEGDVVAAGDPLVELETDKIDLEVSAPQAGVLSRISRQDGEDVKVGEVLGVIEEAAAGKGAKPAGPGAAKGPRRLHPRRSEPAGFGVSAGARAAAGGAQPPLQQRVRVRHPRRERRRRSTKSICPASAAAATQGASCAGTSSRPRVAQTPHSPPR